MSGASCARAWRGQAAGGNASASSARLGVPRDRLELALLGEERLTHGPLPPGHLFARLGDQRFVDDPQKFVVLPEAEPERHGQHAGADDKSRERSSSRWSTRLSRSSWPIGRRRPLMDAVNLPPARGPHRRRLKGSPPQGGRCGTGVKASMDSSRKEQPDIRRALTAGSRPPTRSTSSRASRGQAAQSGRGTPGSCTSASTAPASWSTRSTGPRKAPGTGGSCCAAPSASRAGRACSTGGGGTPRRRAGPWPSALLGDLRRMTHANMSEEVEFFARALDADLILPSDF